MVQFFDAVEVLDELGEEGAKLKKIFDDVELVYTTEEEDPRIAEIQVGSPILTGTEQTYYAVTLDGVSCIVSSGQGPTGLWIPKSAKNQIQNMAQTPLEEADSVKVKRTPEEIAQALAELPW